MAFRIIDARGDRQLRLAHRHWRWQYYGLPQLPRHDRSGKQITLSEHAGNTREIRVGGQIGAFDIDMRNTMASLLNNLITRAHHMLAGTQLDLPRPVDIRQQLRNIDGAGGERRNRPGERHDTILAHRIEADGPRRDRDRVAVLNPQHDTLAGRGSG